MAKNTRKFRKSREPLLPKVAFKLGLDYSKEDDFGFSKLLSQFKLFRIGMGKKVTHTMTKNDDWNQTRIAIFDYKYQVQAGNTPVLFYQTVFFIQSKKLSLPSFLIKPEKFFYRIGKYLNLTQDIEFEEHPEFSKNYLIQGEEEDLVKDKLSKNVAHFFTIEKEWNMEGMNYFLIFYQHNKLLSPQEIEDFYKKGLHLFDLLKD